MLIKTSLLGHHCTPQPQVQDTDVGCAPPHTLTPELLPDGSISSSDPSPSSTSSSLYTASYLVRLYARVFMCECVYECVNTCSSHTLHPPKSCRRCTSNSTRPPCPAPHPGCFSSHSSSSCSKGASSPVSLLPVEVSMTVTRLSSPSAPFCRVWREAGRERVSY